MRSLSRVSPGSLSVIILPFVSPFFLSAEMLSLRAPVAPTRTSVVTRATAPINPGIKKSEPKVKRRAMKEQKKRAKLGRVSTPLLCHFILPRPAARAPPAQPSLSQFPDHPLSHSLSFSLSLSLSSQVVDTIVAAEMTDKQVVMCRCWRSGTFPLCNGSHVAHNKVWRGGEGPR